MFSVILLSRAIICVACRMYLDGGEDGGERKRKDKRLDREKEEALFFLFFSSDELVGKRNSKGK